VIGRLCLVIGSCVWVHLLRFIHIINPPLHGIGAARHRQNKTTICLRKKKKHPGPRGLGMGLPDQTDFKTHYVVDIRDKSSSKAFDQAHQHSTHLHLFRPKLAYLCIDFDPILLLKVHPLTLVRFWGASGQTLGPMPNV